MPSLISLRGVQVLPPRSSKAGFLREKKDLPYARRVNTCTEDKKLKPNLSSIGGHDRCAWGDIADVQSHLPLMELSISTADTFI